MKTTLLLLALVTGSFVCGCFAAQKEPEDADNQPLIRTAMTVRIELTDKNVSLREHITLMAAKYFVGTHLSNPSLADVWSSPVVLRTNQNRPRALFTDPPIYQSLGRARVGKMLRRKPEESNFTGGIYSLQMEYPVLGENDTEELTFSYSAKSVPAEMEFQLEYQPLFQNKEYIPPVFFDAGAYVLEIDTAGRFTVEREGGKLIEKGNGVWITKIKNDEPIKLTFKRNDSGR